MRSIRTLEDLVHAVANSLTLISSQAQYLLSRQATHIRDREELQIICEEAQRAASLLCLVRNSLVRNGLGRRLGRDPEVDGGPLTLAHNGPGDGSDGKRRS
jgi:hypothetical protein